MEVLTLNGKRYIKASKAAKDFGYATDYVGQLCRTGAVDAHLVGRTWYVNPDVLGAHRVEKKRNARAKAREYAKKSIEESKSLSINQNTKSPRNIPIRYNTDEEELIPDVKKMSVFSEKQLALSKEDADNSTYTLLNKDKKIIMSGTIPVYDVEEETELTDTTILKPRIQRPQREETRDTSETKDKPEQTTESEISPVKVSFNEKLALQEVSITPDEGDVASQPAQTGALRTSVSGKWYQSDILFYGAIFAIVLVPFSVFFEREIQYTDGGTSEVLQFDSSDIKKFLTN